MRGEVERTCRRRNTLIQRRTNHEVGASMEKASSAQVEPLLACPDCGASHVTVVEELDLIAFLCDDCGACWRIELGYIRRFRLPAGFQEGPA